MPKPIANPYKPGAGHSPPHLAGRKAEIDQFRKLLHQDPILQNVVLTGLRGVGKTVLMEDAYKPVALQEGWIWVGSNLSEAAFVDEKSLCQRILTDLSLFTSNLTLTTVQATMGLHGLKKDSPMTYDFLAQYFESRPGLTADKLKDTLAFIWNAVEATGKRGVLFAYDEAQVVQDRKDKDQYPLALLLECFQSLQRKGMRYMLLLTGLPTLFTKLVESRTYAERMFTVQEIGRLDKVACKEAIEKPLDKNTFQLTPESVELIIESSGRYPYFVQFICRESFDHFKFHLETNAAAAPPAIPMSTLLRKLDSDFFAGRWGRATDRQRQLLLCIASLPHSSDEFMVSEIVEVSKSLAKTFRFRPFKAGDVSQLLPKVIDAGLIYKNRYGKYSLSVPLFDSYIKRQFEQPKGS